MAIFQWRSLMANNAGRYGGGDGDVACTGGKNTWSILLVCALGIWDGIRVVGAFACDLWLGLHIECIYVEMIDVGN